MSKSVVTDEHARPEYESLVTSTQRRVLLSLYKDFNYSKQSRIHTRRRQQIALPLSIITTSTSEENHGYTRP